jgi:hypothetical protein
VFVKKSLSGTEIASPVSAQNCQYRPKELDSKIQGDWHVGIDTMENERLRLVYLQLWIHLYPAINPKTDKH